MARALDYDAARELLTRTFEQAESDFRDGTSVVVPEGIVAAPPKLFQSRTQAYREALLGCAIAHLLDPKIDIHKPYVGHGVDAYFPLCRRKPASMADMDPKSAGTNIVVQVAIEIVNS